MCIVVCVFFTVSGVFRRFFQSLVLYQLNGGVYPFYGHYQPRKRADGTVSYTTQIRINRNGAQVYQETQAFARKQAAQAWIRRREAELYEPDAVEKVDRVGVCLTKIIDRYLAEVEKAGPPGKTKCATLKAISLTA